jgi:hypothetical protein
VADMPGTQPPAPPPETVTASRRHLTIRYALGVDCLLWETEKRTMPDMDAVRAVVSASADTPPADTLDIAAALVTVQAMRLELDALEADVLDAAQQAGVSAEAVAAALELPDAASATARHKMLIARRNAPRANAQQGTQEDPQSAARVAASAATEHAGRRARQAASRAVEARRRREELTASREQASMIRERLAASQEQLRSPRERPTDPETASAAQAAADLVFGAETHQERLQVASAHASEARLNARDSAERVALGLLRAADALDRCAVRCQEWAESVPGQEKRARQQQRATEYLRAARTYREMAATYRNIGRHLP